MEPKDGDRIKIIFKTGLVEEGIVKIWSQEESIIELSDSFLIIPNTFDNVLAARIMKTRIQKPSIAVTEPLDVDEYSSHELRSKKLSELHQMRINQERENARRALLTKEPNDFRGPSYDPRRTTIPRKLQPIPKYPQEKA